MHSCSFSQKPSKKLFFGEETQFSAGLQPLFSNGLPFLYIRLRTPTALSLNTFFFNFYFALNLSCFLFHRPFAASEITADTHFWSNFRKCFQLFSILSNAVKVPVFLGFLFLICLVHLVFSRWKISIYNEDACNSVTEVWGGKLLLPFGKPGIQDVNQLHNFYLQNTVCYLYQHCLRLNCHSTRRKLRFHSTRRKLACHSTRFPFAAVCWHKLVSKHGGSRLGRVQHEHIERWGIAPLDSFDLRFLRALNKVYCYHQLAWHTDPILWRKTSGHWSFKRGLTSVLVEAIKVSWNSLFYFDISEILLRGRNWSYSKVSPFLVYKSHSSLPLFFVRMMKRKLMNDRLCFTRSSQQLRN